MIERSQQVQIVIEAAYKWRAADIHHAACRLKIRQGEEEKTSDEVEKTLRHLRIEIDALHRRDKQ